MDDKLVRQVFEELLPSLEALDTKCAGHPQPTVKNHFRGRGIPSANMLARTRTRPAVSLIQIQSIAQRSGNSRRANS